MIGALLTIELALGMKFLMANLHYGSIKNKITITANLIIIYGTFTINDIIESAITKVELPDSPEF